MAFKNGGHARLYRLSLAIQHSYARRGHTHQFNTGLTTITNPLTFPYVIKVKLVSVRWSIITQVYNKLPDYCS